MPYHISSTERSFFLVLVTLLVLIVIGVGACVSPSKGPSTATPVPPTPTSPRTPSPTKPSLPKDWVYRWLQGVPCQPPCWEGVTPGQTTATEAVEIWGQSPVIATVEIQNIIRITPDLGVVTWNWASSGKKGGEAYFHAQKSDSPIYAIRPDLPPVKLRDVIQAYGDPSHIMAGSERPDGSDVLYSLIIFYQSQGFILYTGGRTKPILSEDTILGEVWFFAPGFEGLQNASPAFGLDPKQFVPWQGMKGFDFYCRDLAGNPCP